LISFIDIAPTILSLANIEIPEYMHGQAFLGDQESTPRKFIHGARDRMDTEYDRVRSVCDGRYVYIKNYHPELPWKQDIEYRENMGTMICLQEQHMHGELNEIQEQWFIEKKPEEILFDTETDPWEINDLAGNPEYAEKLDELRNAHIEWLERYGDMGEIPEEKMVESMWPGLIQPQTDLPEVSKEGNKISLKCPTAGASLVYRFSDTKIRPDDSEPNEWKLYSKPISIPDDNFLYVVASRIGYLNSEIKQVNMKEIIAKNEKE